MKKETTRFLAVLAILAVVFAVVSFSEQSEAATEIEIDGQDAYDGKLASLTPIAVSENDTITLTAAPGYWMLGNVNIYYASMHDASYWDRTLLKNSTHFTFSYGEDYGSATITFTSEGATAVNEKYLYFEEGVLSKETYSQIIEITQLTDLTDGAHGTVIGDDLISFIDGNAYTFKQSFNYPADGKNLQIPEGNVVWDIQSGVTFKTEKTPAGPVQFVEKSTLTIVGYGTTGSTQTKMFVDDGTDASLVLKGTTFSSIDTLITNITGRVQIYDGAEIEVSNRLVNNSPLDVYGGIIKSLTLTTQTTYSKTMNIGTGDQVPTFTRLSEISKTEGFVANIGNMIVTSSSTISPSTISQNGYGNLCFQGITFTETEAAPFAIPSGSKVTVGQGSNFTILASALMGTLEVDGGTLVADSLTTIYGELIWEINHTNNLTVKKNGAIVLNNMVVTATEDSIISYAKSTPTLTLTSGEIDIAPIAERVEDFQASLVLTAQEGKATFNGVEYTAAEDGVTANLNFNYTHGAGTEVFTSSITAGSASVVFEKASALGVGSLEIDGAANAGATVTIADTNVVTLTAGTATLVGTSAGTATLGLDGGIATIDDSVIQKSGSVAPTMTLTTSVGAITSELATGAVSVAMKADSEYGKFTALATTVIEDSIDGTDHEYSILKGNASYADTGADGVEIGLASGATLTVAGQGYANTSDEARIMVVTYDSDHYVVAPKEGSITTEQISDNDQQIVIKYSGDSTITFKPEAVDPEAEPPEYLKTIVAYTIDKDGNITDITLREGKVSVTVTGDGTDFYALAGTIVIDATHIEYAVMEDSMFGITTTALALKDGGVMVTLSEGGLDEVTWTDSNGDDSKTITLTLLSDEGILGLEAEYTEATETTGATYVYQAAIFAGEFNYASATGSELYLNEGAAVTVVDPTYTAEDDTLIDISATGEVTIVSGTLSFVSDLQVSTDVILLLGSAIVVDGNTYTSVLATEIQIGFNPAATSDAYDVVITEGTVQATLTAGSAVAVHNMTFTAVDAAVIDAVIGTTYAADLVSGEVILSGSMSSADTLTRTGGTILIKDVFNVNGGVFSADATISAAGDDTGKIILARGATVDAKITTINSSNVSAYAVIDNLVAGSQGIQIYPGSVIITGSTSGAAVELSDGTVSFVDFVIEEGATVTVTGTTKIEGTITNNGTLILKDQCVDEAEIEGNEIVDKRKNVMEDQEVSGDATEDHVYPANQRIIVRGSWTILKGADVTIKGELVVPEGTKLTVENGASLKVIRANAEISGTLVIDYGDDKTADGIFYVENGNVDVYGKVIGNGEFQVVGTSSTQGGVVTLHESAEFTVGADGELIVGNNGKIVVMDSSKLVIEGASDAQNIYNYGTVEFNTQIAATGDSIVYQMANGATVDIKNYTIGYTAGGQKTLTIDDSRLVFYTDKSTKGSYVYYVVEDGSYIKGTDQDPVAISDNNALVISSSTVDQNYTSTISGLKVVEKVTSVESDDPTAEHYANGRIYTNTMDLSGEVKKTSAYIGTGTGSSKTYTYTMDLAAARDATVTGTLKLPVGVTLNNGILGAESFLKVSGELDASAYSSASTLATFANVNGTITLEGSGIIKSRNLDATVHAAKTQVNTTSKTYHFMTVDSMIAACNADGSTIEEFEVVGTKNYVTKTASIPGNVKMIVSGELYIGSQASDIETMLTLKNGGEIKGSGTITVYGTLYAENATNVKNSVTIISDIKTTQVDEKGKVVKDGWAKWTNLTLALSSAVAGDEINVTKEEGYVWLYSSAEVKEGVVLKIVDDAVPLVIANGVTLTVNGVFITEQKVYAQSMFDLVAKNDNGNTPGDRSSAIVVNGAMLMDIPYNYAYNPKDPTTGTDAIVAMSDGAPIAGAYFSTDDYSYAIAGIETAFDEIEEITSAIKINGQVNAADLYFMATETCSRIEVGANINNNYKTAFNFGQITLDGATITGISTGSIKGAITAGDGTLVVDGVAGAFSAADKDGKLVLTGAYNVPKDATFQIAYGSVYAGTAANALSVAVNADAKEVSVASGATLVANGTDATFSSLEVEGTLDVPNNKAIKVTVLTIDGSVIVAPATATASAGSLTGTRMFIGMNSDDISAGEALSGPFAYTGYILVHSGSSIDPVAQAILDKQDSTEFYVEGLLWFTAYSPSSATITVSDAPIESALLVGWCEDPAFDGEIISKTTAITIGAHDELYAKINYEIYMVTIKTDAGIKEISLNGKLMMSPASGENLFWLDDLRAGTYKVSYTLIDGYEGTATLKTIEGTILQNNSFTVSGLDNEMEGGYYVFAFQLNGTEPIPEPEPTPTPEPEKQSEWTITTILLCILVVLIAIMAVIVALRLNRN